MSNFEQRSIEAFEKLKIVQNKLKFIGRNDIAYDIFVARMDINAYVCELKLQRSLKPEVK